MSDFAYDPVTAIDESAAVGDTAMVFAEIRRTMGIPLVTSIWRGLAGMDDSLRPAWDAAKPSRSTRATNPSERLHAASQRPTCQVRSHSPRPR
jgi:hypothetical protein